MKHQIKGTTPKPEPEVDLEFRVSGEGKNVVFLVRASREGHQMEVVRIRKREGKLYISIPKNQSPTEIEWFGVECNDRGYVASEEE